LLFVPDKNGKPAANGKLGEYSDFSTDLINKPLAYLKDINTFLLADQPASAQITARI